MTQTLKVLVVDDSAVYRRLLQNIIGEIQHAEVVGTAPSGSVALQKIAQLRPHIVLQDIEMPEMSGIEVLEAVKEKFPEVAVVLVSGVNSRSADIVVEGLSKGAADFIPKPDSGTLRENTEHLKRELRNVLLAVRTAMYSRQVRQATLPKASPAASLPRPTPRLPVQITQKVEIVAVGVSTGGPKALDEIIPALPADFSVPIVIVQHMPPVFTSSLARALDDKSEVQVYEAADGQTIKAGCVYIAPGGIHLKLRRGQTNGVPELLARLEDSPPVNSCKPAVDILFQSVAEVTGGRTLAVVMTGMGQDGLNGVNLIKKEGGYCITQSEETCVVYGMPLAVDAANLSDESVPLWKLANRIKEISGHKSHF
ncbi:MAG: chemotaxis-specific protein-glutamate methyltransferase CheB [SAR324 cluster bacterium]|nr:chemotaxis-specific protein-glutamate methyltransferase CheB [SAR324 cluster bacterium]